MHSIRHRCRRQRQPGGSYVANRWIGSYAVGAARTRRINVAAAEQESTGIRAQPDRWIVLILLRQENPPARRYINKVGASSDHCPSVAGNVIGKTDPWRKVILVAVPHTIGVLSQLQQAARGPRRPGDPSALIADASAIRKTLGWRTLYGLDDMIDTALAWERRQQRDLMQVS